MGSLIVLPLIVALSQAPAGEAGFGPPQRMRCEWFSNFENSRFERCSSDSRPVVAEAAIPVFAAGVAASFDRAARKLGGRSVDGVPWGVFDVEIVGRRGLTRREHSRYIGDARWDVKVERLIAMRLIRRGD